MSDQRLTGWNKQKPTPQRRATTMRIPVIMCHGISDQGDYPLSEEHFSALVRVG